MGEEEMTTSYRRYFATFHVALLILFLGCMLATSAHADSFARAKGFSIAANRADEILAEIASNHAIPAVAGSVWKGDGVGWSGGVGFVNLEQGTPVTQDSKFRLGSVSKVLTASLAGILVQEGAVDLDMDIRTYVPSFPDKGHTITLRQLLGHLGGIRHYVRTDFNPMQPGGMIDLRLYPNTESTLALFANDDLVATLRATDDISRRFMLLC